MTICLQDLKEHFNPLHALLTFFSQTESNCGYSVVKFVLSNPLFYASLSASQNYGNMKLKIQRGNTCFKQVKAPMQVSNNGLSSEPPEHLLLVILYWRQIWHLILCHIFKQSKKYCLNLSVNLYPWWAPILRWTDVFSWLFFMYHLKSKPFNKTWAWDKEYWLWQVRWSN